MKLNWQKHSRESGLGPSLALILSQIGENALIREFRGGFKMSQVNKIRIDSDSSLRESHQLRRSLLTAMVVVMAVFVHNDAQAQGFNWNSNNASVRGKKQTTTMNSWNDVLLAEIVKQGLNNPKWTPKEFKNCRDDDDTRFMWLEYFKGLSAIETNWNPSDRSGDSAGGDGLWQFSKGDVGFGGSKCLQGKDGFDLKASMHCVVSMQKRLMADCLKKGGACSIVNRKYSEENYGPVRRLASYQRTCQESHLKQIHGDGQQARNLISHVNQRFCKNKKNSQDKDLKKVTEINGLKLKEKVADPHNEKCGEKLRQADAEDARIPRKIDPETRPAQQPRRPAGGIFEA